jgi:hypothetical protein
MARRFHIQDATGLAKASFPYGGLLENALAVDKVMLAAFRLAIIRAGLTRKCHSIRQLVFTMPQLLRN